MTDEAPKTALIAEVEFHEAQALQLLDLFDHSGWKHFVRILENHRKVELSTAFGESENTHAQYALSHGIYSMIETLLAWPDAARATVEETFYQK